MLRLGRLTDYAVTLLSHMDSRGNGALWSAPGLAEQSGIPMPTVAKILKLLAKGGLIVAQRGASGGYKLARGATAISVAEIIEVMDGPIAITDCAHTNKDGQCKIHSLCPLSLGWNKVNDALRQALGDVSLAEMFALPTAFDDGAPRAQKGI